MKAKLCLLAVFVLSIVVVGLVSPVIAPVGGPTFIKFNGTITQGGSACVGDKVEIEKYNSNNWVSLGTDITDTNGEYDIPSTVYYGATYENDTYRLTINDGEYVTEKEIKDNDWTCTYVPSMPPQPPSWQCVYQWDIDFNPIPEFTTISIPIATILGLLFFFSYRKRRKEGNTKEKDNDFEVGE